MALLNATLWGALCLTNAATATVQRDLVDAAKFIYDSLSQTQVQKEELSLFPEYSYYYDFGVTVLITINHLYGVQKESCGFHLL